MNRRNTMKLTVRLGSDEITIAGVSMQDAYALLSNFYQQRDQLHQAQIDALTAKLAKATGSLSGAVHAHPPGS